jgi:translation initiation factor IF-1
MVKNSGGNKAKKQSRKGVAVPTAVQNVRYVSEIGEMYAVVTTIFGGKNCQVMCDDGISRRCTIRRKFMMSRRGDNMIVAGTWVMVGLYDWEKRSDGTQTCDIIEVYSPGEKEKLKQTVNAKKLHHIIIANNEFDGNKNGNEFLFSNTLGSIAYDPNDEGEEDDLEDKEETAKKLIPLKDLPVTTESAKEQNDWMIVNENDI